MKNILLCTLVALCFSSPANAALIDVSSYPGFDNTCTSDPSAAFIAAEAAAKVGERIIVPAGTYLPITGLAGNKKLVWDADGATNCAGTAIVDVGTTDIVKANHPTGTVSRVQFRRFRSVPDQFGEVEIKSNSTHTGGTGIYSPLRVQLDVANGATDSNWTQTNILNNSASAGSSVAIFNQGNKKGTGWTAASVSEAHDWTGQANPAGGLVGHEIDVKATGTDNAGYANRGSRVGMTIEGMKHNDADAQTEIGYGIWGYCATNTGLISATFCKFKRFINIEAPFLYGFDTSLGTQDANGAAIKMLAGQSILLGSTGTGEVRIKLDAANRKILFLENGVVKGHLLLNGADHAM